MGKVMKKLLSCLSLILLGSCSEISTASSVLIEDTVSIKEDDFLKIELEIPQSTKVKIFMELKEGPPLDVYLLDQKNYNIVTTALEGHINDIEFRHERLKIDILRDSLESDWRYLSKGKYGIIVDNSDWFDVKPPFNLIDDTAILEYKVLER